MPFKEVGKIWMDGKLVDWKEAKIHVLSHVVHYGSSVFEGFRSYKNKKGSAIFRLQAHTDRLFNSAKIYRMKIPFTKEQINKAIIELMKTNELEECYVRPIVYRGYAELGVDPRPCPVNVTIAVWHWGAYLGPEALENGVSVCVSSWNRMAPNTFPAMAKSGANYMNSQLVKLEALAHGYVEGIALDVYGHVSEGSGENIFIIRDKTLITPPFGASILPGITRNTVITLAQELGIKVIEQLIPRESLYIAEEVFFTGSAAEITPISSIDGIQIGAGRRGPMTKQLQDKFFGVVSGEQEDKWGWLTYVDVGKKETAYLKA